MENNRSILTPPILLFTQPCKLSSKDTLELLKFVLSTMDRFCFFGLCIHIDSLYLNGHINKDEHYSLTLYMEDNKPEGADIDKYWWPKGEKEPRLDWINKQIQILEKQSI